MTPERTLALRRYNKAASAFEDHIYTKRGTVRAVLAHEKAYHEARKEQLRSEMRAAYKAYKNTK